jgi:hypothetical protein
LSGFHRLNMELSDVRFGSFASFSAQSDMSAFTPITTKPATRHGGR